MRLFAHVEATAPDRDIAVDALMHRVEERWAGWQIAGEIEVCDDDEHWTARCVVESQR